MGDGAPTTGHDDWSQTPWQCYGGEDYGETTIYDCDESNTRDYEDSRLDSANADRIQACVNGCANVDHPSYLMTLLTTAAKLAADPFNPRLPRRLKVAMQKAGVVGVDSLLRKVKSLTVEEVAEDVTTF